MNSGDLEESGYKGFKLIDRVVLGPHIHHTEHLIFKIPKKYALMNIHDLIEKIVIKSGVQDGFVFVSTMHTSAAVYVNDSDTGLLHDIAHKLTELAPFSEVDYEYNTASASSVSAASSAAASASLSGGSASPDIGITKDNGDAHLKSILVHHSVNIPITKYKLDIGPDQYIYYAEFDGKRDKRIIVKVTGINAANANITPQSPAHAKPTQSTEHKHK
jgi:thiamine phosphate synthase YjbQ (UPF0047 family)